MEVSDKFFDVGEKFLILLKSTGCWCQTVGTKSITNI